ncbi:MAG: response regulator, partial [Saprospiraceae bacterium]
MIRVLLFEDNSDFADSVTELIANTEGITLVGVCENAKNVVRNIAFYKPDIVLMDIDMPVENGLQ